MPRGLKRRSEAISRDNESPPPSPSPEPTQHRNRRRSSSESTSDSSASVDGETQNGASRAETSIQTLSKKLIRLALSSEYSRLPIRRNDITQKIFKESNASHRLFKPVFTETQRQLRTIFGMELFELPSKEKTTLKDRRTQATQTQTQSKATSGGSSGGGNTKSWILISTLPPSYKNSPSIILPSKVPTPDLEAQYTGLYTFILALIYLNNSSLAEAKLERYLKRVNADTYTPMGTLEKLLTRMVKEGYLEKRRDTSSGEDLVEYVIGPRGKVEVGVRGVAGLVKSVYGFGSVPLGMDASAENEDSDDDNASQDGGGGGSNNNNGSEPRRLVKMERDELEKRLARSLGEGVVGKGDRRGVDAVAANANGNGDVEVDEHEAVERPRRGRRRRNNDDDD